MKIAQTVSGTFLTLLFLIQSIGSFGFDRGPIRFPKQNELVLSAFKTTQGKDVRACIQLAEIAEEDLEQDNGETANPDLEPAALILYKAFDGFLFVNCTATYLPFAINNRLGINLPLRTKKFLLVGNLRL